MLEFNLDIFFQNPEESRKRDLYPATVKGLNDKFYTVKFIEKELNLEVDSQVLIYYEHNLEFVQQSARVEALDEADTKQVIIDLKGKTVSAENRQFYRLSTTIVTGLTASLGSEENFPLNDISITGFSVTTHSQLLKIGTLVEVVLRYEDESCSGTVCVQSIRELNDGKLRYGLHCPVDDSGSRSELKRGLGNIALTIQREQMQRLSGNQ